MNSGLAHLASVCRRRDWRSPAAPLASRRRCRQHALGPEAARARARPTRLCRALHAPAPHALLVRLALLTHSAYAAGLLSNCGARISVDHLAPHACGLVKKTGGDSKYTAFDNNTLCLASC